MSDISSPGAETYNGCVSGATFVKRFANSLEVAGSVGPSAPTDPDHFLIVRLAVAVWQQRWTYAHCHFLQMDDHFALYCLVLGVGTTLVSVVSQILAAIALLQSLVIRKARSPALDIQSSIGSGPPVSCRLGGR